MILKHLAQSALPRDAGALSSSGQAPGPLPCAMTCLPACLGNKAENKGWFSSVFMSSVGGTQEGL